MASCAQSRRSSASTAIARSASVKRLTSDGSVPWRETRPSSTLVITSSRGTRLNCWKIIAQRARQRSRSRPRSADTGSPFHEIWPDVGSASRLIIRSSVDFPAPERPMTPTIWPSGISSDIDFSASTLPNVFLTALISSTVTSMAEVAD